MFTYATLIVGRVKFAAITITVDGRKRYLDVSQARDHFERTVVGPSEETYRKQISDWEQRRQRMLESVIVRENVTVKRDPTRRFSDKRIVDEVEIGGHVEQVEPGTAKDFIRVYLNKTLSKPQTAPHDDYDTWFRKHSREVRTWRAQFITDEETADIDLGELSWEWGYPVSSAVRQLNRLAADGWDLLHVSEDHGLYTGADVANESYPARVRYLLGKA